VIYNFFYFYSYTKKKLILKIKIMSHFTVLVLGDNPEEQLAPYCEQDEKYMSFVDKTKELEKEYNTKKTSEFYCSSSCSWGMEISEDFYKKLSRKKVGENLEQVIEKKPGLFYYEKGKYYKGYYAIPSGKRMKSFRWFKVISVLETTHPDKNICFEGKICVQRVARPKKIPMSQKYKTVEDFAKDYCGYQEKNGKYGYMSNENSKWDWYELGGRWTGFFKLKSGAKGKNGKPGLMTSPAKLGTTDQAFKKDIDFDAMYAEKLEDAIKTYEAFEKLYKENPQEALDKAYLDFGVENTSGNRDNFIPETRERYLSKRASISTFAVVKNGKWYEKGEMGWWACVSNEKDQKGWNQEFKKLLDEIPEDTMLSLYDCHI